MGELAKKTNLSQPLVSQHLCVLKKTDLMRTRWSGGTYPFDAEHTARNLKSEISK
ncbi:MAG: helix-turn-helix transcriptional regulator [Chloroflexi bacterium]|nr:helix-turn-helix transcriptional regulator [Chloroflexota bacterium]